MNVKENKRKRENCDIAYSMKTGCTDGMTNTTHSALDHIKNVFWYNISW